MWTHSARLDTILPGEAVSQRWRAANRAACVRRARVPPEERVASTGSLLSTLHECIRPGNPTEGTRTNKFAGLYDRCFNKTTEDSAGGRRDCAGEEFKSIIVLASQMVPARRTPRSSLARRRTTATAPRWRHLAQAPPHLCSIECGCCYRRLLLSSPRYRARHRLCSTTLLRRGSPMPCPTCAALRARRCPCLSPTSGLSGH